MKRKPISYIFHLIKNTRLECSKSPGKISQEIKKDCSLTAICIYIYICLAAFKKNRKGTTTKPTKNMENVKTGIK